MAFSNDLQNSDRRLNARINWIDSEVQVTIMSSSTMSKILGWIRDISQEGFKLKAEIPLRFDDLFQERDEIYFETFEDFFQLKGKGRIIWTSSNENMAGIRIDSLDAESRKHLYGFLGIPPIG